jgi:hypothetical protein
VLGLLILAAQVDPSVAERAAPQPAAPRLSLRPGEGAFLEHRLEGPARRFGATDRPNLEVLVDRLGGPIDVAPRGEIVSLAKTEAAWTLRVAVVIRSASAQGSAAYRIRLVDRRGFGSALIERDVRVELVRSKASWSDEELAFAFHAADQYRVQAQRLLRELRRRGVRATLQPDEPRPPLLRARDETMRSVQAFEAARRRMAMGRRRLIAAARAGNETARRLLDQLRRPPGERRQVPPVPRPKAGASAPPPESTSRTDEEGVLEPIEAYELGSESRSPPPTDTRAPGSGSPPRTPEAPVQSEARPEAPAPEEAASQRPRPVRGLVLDGAAIGFGGGTRFVRAEARLLRSAQTNALFIFAEAAFSRDFGFEVGLPVQFVSSNDFDARDVTSTGNPNLTVKYRLWLPELAGTPVALVLRGRYGIPLTPESRFAPTSVVADDFSREVHFVEPQVFLVDRHDFALGSSGAWRRGWLSLSAQLWLDYFVPIGAAETLADFAALSYGLGVGVLPLSQLELGPFAEFRGTSILAGGGRTEGTFYFGARGRFFGWFEPGAYAGVPVGGLAESSGVQLGLELRFATPWPEPPPDPRLEDPLR